MGPVSSDRTLSSLVWEGGWGWLSKQTTTTNNLIREAPVLKQFKQNYFPFLSQCRHILRCHLLKTHSWNLWGVGPLSKSACQTAPDSLLASAVKPGSRPATVLTRAFQTQAIRREHLGPVCFTRLCLRTPDSPFLLKYVDGLCEGNNGNSIRNSMSELNSCAQEPTWTLDIRHPCLHFISGWSRAAMWEDTLYKIETRFRSPFTVFLFTTQLVTE